MLRLCRLDDLMPHPEILVAPNFCAERKANEAIQARSHANCPGTFNCLSYA